MIRKIGIDIVEIARFRRVENKRAFLEQILTEKELLNARTVRDQDAFFATLFAVKEAVLKALECGLKHGSYWHDIEISTDSNVTLSGAMDKIAKSKSASRIHVSTSRSKTYSVALAVAEGS